MKQLRVTKMNFLSNLKNAFITFNNGLFKMPLYWQVWLALLVMVNAIIPLFFLYRIEAWMVLAAFFANTLIMTTLTAFSGFTRLLGLGHIFWVPLLYFLWTRLSQIPATDFFGIWIPALMVLNAESLVIDAVDVFRYIAGDREETVQI